MAKWVNVICPSCHDRFRLRDDAVGRNVPCPGCGKPFVADPKWRPPPPVEVTHAPAPPPRPASPPAEKIVVVRGSGCSQCLMGCLLVVLIFLILNCAAGGVLFAI